MRKHSYLMFFIILSFMHILWPSKDSQASNQQGSKEECARLLGEIERRGNDLMERCVNDIMLRTHGTIGVIEYKKDKREFDLLRERFISMECDDYGSPFISQGIELLGPASDC